jgi:SAM-dependent methyltransferase
MQTKKDLDQWYATKKDPWSYSATTDDALRKAKILDALGKTKFKRALDIGCGEGWITKDLPAQEIHGYELSDVAASRFPPNVARVLEPIGKYDLVLATGVLYAQYDWQSIAKFIVDHASGTVLTCNIKSWEIPDAIAMIPGKQSQDVEFYYRLYVQKLRVFKV